MKLSLALTVSIAIAVSFSSAQAQVNPEAFGLYNDAFRFSQTRHNGSARIQGIGGAQVALGGDLSSAMSNPAGLGFFNKSEFSFSPSLNFHSRDAAFGERIVGTESENFNFNQLGIVFHTPLDEDSDLKGLSFAISLNRINDFKEEITYDSQDLIVESSIIDFFRSQAEGITPQNLNGLTVLGFDTYLIDLIPDTNNQYFSIVDGFPRHQETIKRSGAQYQWSFAAGANYQDRLHFGGNIGFTTLNYRETKSYLENDFVLLDNQGEVVGSDNVINDLFLDEQLDMDGIGVNATFGLIYRPVRFATFGLAYSSPTWYAINEEITSDLEVNYNNYFYPEGDTLLGNLPVLGPLVISNYTLRTPSKVNLGAAFFLGKSGFITGDVEFVNYGNANLSSNDFSVNADNQTISNLYNQVVNFRLGTEWRLQNFRFRGGVAHWADPIDADNIDNSQTNLSLGLGYRNKKFFADFAVISSMTKEVYNPYFLPGGSEPTINIDKTSTNAVVTLGFNF
ncbi:MAG: hypothetical protein RJQ09_10905 [Cyclobacteriaceae bacterium]